ncbi:MAG: response regulator [Elusimicrobia bacterium]|nr:response regulator [Elusimicrobiota bacterium]
MPLATINPIPAIKKQYYTTGQIAKFCHVSPTTIFRAIEHGLLKASTTPGGHYRISRGEAEGFLKKNKISLNVLESQTIRILIVEDNPMQLRFFQRALGKDSELELKTTNSGYEAGFLTRSFRPNIILLDIFLKDMDGRQVVKLIRSDPELKHTKILAITAATSSKDIEEIKASGVSALLQKPISSTQLHETIKSFFK